MPNKYEDPVKHVLPDKKKCIRKSLYYLALILCSNQKHGSTIKHNITSFIFFALEKIKKLDLKNIYARI